jgi:TPR repeat protein
MKRMKVFALLVVSLSAIGSAQTPYLSALRTLAGKGDPGAQYMLGRLYYVGIDGVEKDIPMGIALFCKAANQGDIDAEYMLGVAYSYGQGVPQNYVHAAFWYQKAASRGDEKAQLGLGELYLNGGILTEEDGPDGKSKPLIRDDGGGAFPQNYGLAATWLGKAAEQGNADAQNDFGSLFENGNGVPQDYAEAYFWYSLAVSKTPFYTGNRNRVASNLTKTVLLQTQVRARNWMESHAH